MINANWYNINRRNRMKTGIITFHRANHYGAQLQAYALMRAVEMLGAECEVIDYVRKDTIEAGRLFKKPSSLRNILSNAHTLLHYTQFKKRAERYESFRKEEMHHSPKFYGSLSELYNDAPEYDVYICGSDQVWNPFIFKENTFDPAFFADFARGGRRVAYAPSFGISELPEKYQELLRDYLSKFEFLSVREKQGADIIKSVTGRDAATVLDPTLLLTGSQWKEVASEAPNEGKPYILCYFITNPSGYSDYVDMVAKKLKLPVISLCGARQTAKCSCKSVLDAGPREFLALFSNASFICTNSFHGTVFSINFEKDFICFTDKMSSEKAVNSRVYSILEILGLPDRIYAAGTGAGGHAGEKSDISDKLRPIDYNEVNRLLQQERDLSLKYLEEAIFSA